MEDMFLISDWELIGYMTLFSVCFLFWLWWTGK